VGETASGSPGVGSESERSLCYELGKASVLRARENDAGSLPLRASGWLSRLACFTKSSFVRLWLSPPPQLAAAKPIEAEQSTTSMTVRLDKGAPNRKRVLILQPRSAPYESSIGQPVSDHRLEEVIDFYAPRRG
jgi:hypothetical protein